MGSKAGLLKMRRVIHTEAVYMGSNFPNIWFTGVMVKYSFFYFTLIQFSLNERSICSVCMDLADVTREISPIWSKTSGYPCHRKNNLFYGLVYKSSPCIILFRTFLWMNFLEFLGVELQPNKLTLMKINTCNSQNRNL